MKFNIQFVLSLIIIVLITLSFVLIIIELTSFSNRKPFILESTGAAAGAKVELSKVSANDTMKFVEIGTLPDELVSSTHCYRYFSLLLHVLTVASGGYLLYDS